jgi:hypothetical protein
MRATEQRLGLQLIMAMAPSWAALDDIVGAASLQDVDRSLQLSLTSGHALATHRQVPLDVLLAMLLSKDLIWLQHVRTLARISGWCATLSNNQTLANIPNVAYLSLLRR